MDETLRVGVIGVGHLGQHHARVYAELENCVLAGVADLDVERARLIAKRHDTMWYKNYTDLCEQVDAVSIAVPTQEHHAIGMECLRRGIHVLIEKPIARTLEEADQLIELGAKQHCIIQVGHTERFNAAVVELAKITRRPAFIESNRLSPFPERSTDIDVVLDIMIHDIDIILSLVKSPVKKLDAVGVPVITSKVDIANTRLEFESGCIANVTASRVSLKQERKLRIFQPERYLSLDYQAQSLNAVEIKNPELRHDFPNARPSIAPHQVPVTKQEPLKAELKAFVACVRSGGSPVVSGKDGRNALKTAFQILQTMRIASEAPRSSSHLFHSSGKQICKA
ncbi:UDP-N-acetyl-D-glucosamine dehydrogenase [candidate division KSB3 bacterium]|uniref:UDP-N-acetyl-D-glucosamine dehydrogenase n=1 Tax=candidate division KSB3 bacterium TaxID=2044937 RepID=A0A2G6E612_9BACT|nr:MAG: UDP-N-acetyl-D-glucosamine dehydrogenase [candidate division KSB3 bacterium]PIE30078.1 MAG: UDP-N-acetyl-D-glucosamine dehydrogenase [candidate division KSB3 bacterium]